ncbi:MAG: diguanylate cyclase [Lachnospiraceae bacterium]|nr:diguanylate cyclase [Lachnospiraceae bacterium]
MSLLTAFYSVLNSTASLQSLPNPGRATWQYNLYLILHIISLILTLVLMFLSLSKKTSKAQTAVIMFELGAAVYVLGFIEEILSDTAEGGFIACITQYAGELLLIVSYVFFVSLLCNIRISISTYISLAIISVIILLSLMTTRSTGLFYTYITVNRSGIFSRPELGHSTMFYVVFLFIGIISAWAFITCLKAYKSASPFQKKRLLYLCVSTLMCWIPYILTLSGITGGFEIPALGFTLAGVCLYLCFIQYGFFDSQILGGSNIMDHGSEAIIIVDTNYHVRYQNQRIFDIIGHISEGSNALNHPMMKKILNKEIEDFDVDGHTYEFTKEALSEAGYTLGYMIRIQDCTEHRNAIKSIEFAATHDTLTGLYNRTKFQSLVEQDLLDHRLGTFVMFDMDNFKGVNDKYGHQVGDEVLKSLSEVLHKYGEQRLYSCRLGGDEFCIFIRNVVTRSEVEALLAKIMGFFDSRLAEKGFAGYTTLSAGAYPASLGISFKNLYNATDSFLYAAKTAGKNQFIMGDKNSVEF